MPKSIIYETRGRAREFNELALNHYSGCGHQCTYCYGPDITHTDINTFTKHPHLRVTIEELEQSACSYEKRKETRPILLSFISDPYQPLDETLQLTRSYIGILKSHNLRVTILTKGGNRSMRDFDLLTDQDEYATTLTCINNGDSTHWELFAALPSSRIKALKSAHAQGIKTWVSFEPVIYPSQAIALLHETYRFVDHYKIGTLNYHDHGKTINWLSFLKLIEGELRRLNKPYYIKKDLAAYKGVEWGYWWLPK